MFLISMIAVLLAFFFCIMYGASPSWWIFIDFPSLLVLLITTIPALIQTGLLKDFNNSFRLTMGKKKEASFKEIKRAMEALGLARKTIWYTAIFATGVSLLVLMTQLTDMAAVGPNLAVAILTLVYGAFFNLLLFPMEKQLAIRLLEFDEEEQLKEEIKEKDPSEWL